MEVTKVVLTSLAIIFSANLVKSVLETRANLGRLDRLKKEVSLLASGVESLKREEEYKKSPEFLEREARDKLGLIKKDEKLLILPEPGNILRGSDSQVVNAVKVDKTPNWIKWKKFLFD